MPQQIYPLISIITLNYNQLAHTLHFLESTRNLSYPNFEILVCDMASAADPRPEIHSRNFPNTQVLRSEKNLGFAGGNNWGMRQANGDFFFLVNNDTVLTPGILDELYAVLEKDPSIGAVSPRIHYYDPPRLVQYAGFEPMHPLFGRTRSIGFNQPLQEKHQESRETAAVHGCAMMVSRRIANQTGMFPEKFFLYYEEWDWSERIKKAGFKLWYQGNAVIYHKTSATVGESSPLKIYYETRNRILFMRRNSNPPQLIIFWIYFLALATPKAIIAYLAKADTAAASLFLKAIGWNLLNSSKSET